MKTFNDLVFKQRDGFPSDCTQAVINFENGYGISVITGKMFYTNSKTPYEVAMIRNNTGDVVYDNGVFEDVVGWCNKNKVSKLMKYIQEKEAEC